MDALAGLLEGPRAHGVFALRVVMDPPWSLRVRDEAPLSVVSVVRGDAWAQLDGAPPVQLGPGDVAIFRGPDHYTLAGDPTTPPQVVIHPGQRCSTPDGRDMSQAMDLGVRTWGTNPNGSAVMLVGTYQQRTEVGQRLLDALPPAVVLTRDTWDSPLAALLADEIGKEQPGQEAVLDRLVDLLVIAVLRAWFSRAEAAAPNWYRAQGDPVVGKALRILHNNPAHRWTVASLAAEVGISRAALARQFTELVGEGPMSFLTGWRLALAADLLREPDATVGAVAIKVGYGSAFALSTAFKRVRGITPKQHRVAGRGV